MDNVKLCGHQWQDVTGITHTCAHMAGHTVPHLCATHLAWTIWK